MNERLLNAVPTSLTSGATAQSCWTACASLSPALAAPFYFTVTAAGACMCGQNNTVVYEAGATVSERVTIERGTEAPTRTHRMHRPIL